MKNARQAWLRWLSRLPDQSLLPLLRRYLGDFPTPFHKKRLIDKLALWVGGKEIRRQTEAALSREDAELLSSIDFAIEAADWPYLTNFWRQKHPPLALSWRLADLMARLLIFTSQNKSGTTVYCLQPELADFLREKYIGANLLFPTQKTEPVNSPILFSDKNLLACLSDLPNARPLNGAASGLTENSGGDSLRIFLNTLKNLGVVETQGGRLRAVPSGWLRLAEMAPLIRLCRLSAAALTLAAPQIGLSMPAGEQLLLGLAMRAEKNRGYSFAVLRRWLVFWAPGINWSNRKAADLAEALKQIGWLGEANRIWSLNSKVAELAGLTAGETQTRPRLVVQADFTITLLEPPPLKDGLVLASMSRLESFGETITLRLSRDDFFSGLRQNLVCRWRQVLADYVKSPLPQGVSFSLESWEKDYCGLNAYQGILLKADPEKQLLLDNNPDFLAFVKQKPAPGFYFLAAADKAKWRAVLEKLGLSPPETTDFEPKAPQADIYPSANHHLPLFTFQDNPGRLSDDSLLLIKEKGAEQTAGILRKRMLSRNAKKPGKTIPESEKASGLDQQKKRLLIQRADAQSGSLLFCKWFAENLQSRQKADKQKFKEALLLPLNNPGGKDQEPLEALIWPGEKIIKIEIRKIVALELVSVSLFPLKKSE